MLVGVVADRDGPGRDLVWLVFLLVGRLLRRSEGGGFQVR